MRFPKQELNINDYFSKLEGLLKDENCHIFIDTNIISQLYRLNEKARESFYSWVSSCGGRFHIPNWSVHEYSKRVTSKKTTDYLSELTKAKTYSKELNNISKFIKGYVGDSMLVGSAYDGKRQQMFDDIEGVNQMFAKIANAINKRLEEHQQNVHKEVLDKLEHHTLDSNIYDIIGNLWFEHNVRFDGKIPPGFKDSEKENNRIGDLIIWKEILGYCKQHTLIEDKAKVIFISRDVKPDMVYKPLKQIQDSHPINKEEDKIEVAHESLVYEFKLLTKSEDFYIISFYTLVRLLASTHRDLAVSFQLATESENSIDTLTEEIVEPSTEISPNNSVEGIPTETDDIAESSTQICSDTHVVDAPTEIKAPIETISPELSSLIAVESIKYSHSALADAEYDMTYGPIAINECIAGIKTYNWYKQNPAIDKLQTMSFAGLVDIQPNIDSLFVLGRNLLQAADGSSGSAISFLENLHNSISKWPKYFQQAFIDGCLYEVFFNSSGKLRTYPFKASYFETVVDEVEKLDIQDAFNFINSELESKSEREFTPHVGGDNTYKVEIEINQSSDDLPFPYTEILRISINDKDISEMDDIKIYSLTDDNIKQAISTMFAIPLGKMELNVIRKPHETKI